MKVLSLFDGMACGMIAFKKAGIEVDEYTAYEIDKYAIKTATYNFPQIKELGDVFKADFTQFLDIDYIVGGSPCTYWSIAQSSDKRETTASGIGWELFSQYVRALREVKPKFFIYENNKSMSKEIRKSISETFGFEPICINSALLSAQNRQRLYWVGKRNEDGTYSKVDVKQPKDKGISLKDILDSGMDLTTNDKSYTLTASYDGAVAWNTIERKQRNMVSEPVACRCRGRKDKDGNGYAKYECRDDNKYNTVDTNANSAMVAEPVGTTKDNKAFALTAYYSTGQNAPHTLEKHIGSMVAEPAGIGERTRDRNNIPKGQRYEAREDNKTNCLITVQKDCQVAEPIRVGTYPTSDGRLLDSQGTRVYSIEGKSVTQSAQGGGMGAKTGLYAIPVEFEKDIPTKAISCADGKEYPVYEVKNGNITIKDKTYPIKLQDGYYIIRKLTVPECKRLQTVPEWYEFPVSNTQAYKMLGNGWTVDVIAHILKGVIQDDMYNE